MNTPKLMEDIKQKEMYVKHLKVLYDEAFKQRSPDLFLINRELKMHQAIGAELVEKYNKQAQQIKENQATVAKFKEREQKNLRQRILEGIKRRFYTGSLL